MSQDLLREFDSLFAVPAAVVGAVPAVSAPQGAVTSLAGPPGHARSSSAFDDLRALSGLGAAQSLQNAAIARLAPKNPRPASFHGSTPSFSLPSTAVPGLNSDPFAAFSAPSRQAPASSQFIIQSHDNDDDDFGEFSSAAPSPVPTPPPSRPPIVATSSSFGEFASLSQASIGATVSPARIEDDFGDFIDSPSTESVPFSFSSQHIQSHIPAKFSLGNGSSITASRPHSLSAASRHQRTQSASSPPASSLGQQTITLKQSFEISTSTTGPSIVRRASGLQPLDDNFPSVSLLLSAFPPLFGLPQTHLLNKLKGVPYPVRKRILADAQTKEFLEGICELGRVAGRIMSGRKRRIKRTIPGAEGGKTAHWELQKEEREVKECTRTWNEEAGRLRAALGKAVPELNDQPWRGGGPGKRCRLCCLGKEEVLGILREQTDRLGWWDGDWGGHGGCRGFWERHAKSFKIR